MVGEAEGGEDYGEGGDDDGHGELPVRLQCGADERCSGHVHEHGGAGRVVSAGVRLGLHGVGGVDVLCDGREGHRVRERGQRGLIHGEFTANSRRIDGELTAN